MNYISDQYGNEEIPPFSLMTLCGNEAFFDAESGIAYRCTECNAVIGSIGMPKQCKELYAMQEVIDRLKGKK